MTFQGYKKCVALIALPASYQYMTSSDDITTEGTANSTSINWACFLSEKGNIQVTQADHADSFFTQQICESIASDMRQYMEHETAASLASLQWKARITGYTHLYPGSQVWTITRHGEQVGQLRTWSDDSGLYLLDIIVIESARNHGVATECIHALITYTQRKKRELRLDVELTNSKARDLYIRLGFEAISQNQPHLHMIHTSK